MWSTAQRNPPLNAISRVDSRHNSQYHRGFEIESSVPSPAPCLHLYREQLQQKRPFPTSAANDQMQHHQWLTEIFGSPNSLDVFHQAMAPTKDLQHLQIPNCLSFQDAWRIRSISFRTWRPEPLMPTTWFSKSESSASKSPGLIRISLAFAPPSNKTSRICSDVCRTVGTRFPAPISNKTHLNPEDFSLTISPKACIKFFHLSAWCCESNQSRSPHSPNINTAGRAAAPQRAHLGWFPWQKHTIAV